MSLLSDTHPLLTLHALPAVFRIASDNDRDHRTRVRTMSRRAHEALMQEDEPRRRQPRIQPVSLTGCLDTTRRATVELQHLTSPPDEHPTPVSPVPCHLC
jgi:hypothetical protein